MYFQKIISSIFLQAWQYSRERAGYSKRIKYFKGGRIH